MKTTLLHLWVLLVLFGVFPSSLAQGLTIKKQQKIKSFELGSWLKMDVGNLYEDECNYETLHGKLLLVRADSIELEVHQWSKRSCGKDKEEFQSIENFSQQGLYQKTVAKNQVVVIEKASNSRKEKRRENRFTWGGILLMIGIGTSGHSLLAEKGDSRTRLLTAGAIEAGLGIFLMSISNRKTFLLQSKDENCEKCLWEIQ